jgi:hypothetical protein
MSQNTPWHAADSLPTRSDFNPWGPGALDAECAWRNFGGSTLAEAHSKFRERPDVFQEDFMFMGGKAFAFYFSVVEDYLREVPDEENEGDDRKSWILAKCIQNQFEANTAHHVLHLSGRVIALSLFIRNNLRLFGYDEVERKRIADAWEELEAQVQAASNPKRAESETGDGRKSAQS